MANFDPPGPNPFGFADHTPFAAFGVELVYGVRPDGSLVHISEAIRGLACGCICPACGRTLIARKGAIKVEHFGHYGKGTGCGRNAETNAHSWAKDVLGREKRILLPAVGAQIGKDSLETHKQRLFTFANAELEKILDDIVPDVILTTQDGQKLLVEVWVTHACGPEKVEKLKARGLATIEVNLAAWRKSSDREQIEKALIEGAPRDWLYNRKQDDAEATLRTIIAKRAADKADADRKRREEAAAEKEAREAKAKRELNSKVIRVQRAVTTARQNKSNAGRPELEEIGRDTELSDLLLSAQRTCGFLVPNEQWQAALLVRTVAVTIGEDFYLPQFGLESAVRAINDCIEGLFHNDLPDDVRLALPPELRALCLPRQAIEDYLHHLCATGLLQGDGCGGFEVDDDRAKRLEKQQALWKTRKERCERVERVLAKLAELPLDSQIKEFDRLEWERRPIPGFDINLAVLLGAEYTKWSKFEASLLAIERLIEGGEAVSETLGLPVQGAMIRANERARQKHQEEADAREQKLRAIAVDILSSDASAWLYSPPDADAPLYRARNSQGGLDEALQELEAERKIRAEQAAATALAENCRLLLKADSEKALGSALTVPFLNNYDSQLKASPWEICVDQSGLRQARSALEKWVARNRKARKR